MKEERLERKRSIRRLLTGNEAASRLGITPKTLWQWVNLGIVPQVKIPGAKPKYDINDIDELIDRNKGYSEAALAEKKITANLNWVEYEI